MKYITIILLSFSINYSSAQKIKTVNFIDEISSFDISDIWTIEEFPEYDSDSTIIKHNEPLGYIGNNFQRFYIHLISVIQNPENKLEYMVYGKTKVKNNICDFQGKIIITEAFLFKEQDIPEIKEGFIKGEYQFFEDSDQKGTGILKGKLTSEFYINQKNEIKYNSIYFCADGFNNNQFEGTWTSYKNKNPKKCNWGDYRIPDSKDLDGGCGEFIISDKYTNNGWNIYSNAYLRENDKISTEARKKENEEWWKEK